MDGKKRVSLKTADSTVKEKLRKDCRDIGREHRRQILQQHRLSWSPGDLQAKLHADTVAAIRAELRHPQCDGSVYTEADIDDLLRDMQEQIMQEIQEELYNLERSEQQDEQCAMAMADEHMQYLQQLAVGEDAVLCPVCHACTLVQRHGWLVCPSEGWQLNFAAESLHLGDVKARLAAAYQAHAVTSCPGPLKFNVQDLFGSKSLTCSCSVCGSLTVVL